MKPFLTHKWGILGALFGAVAGFLYWKEIGCTTGTCPVKSNWQVMTPYGMVMGYLVADSVVSFLKRSS